MYFPYLRGKQFELLAIKELAEIIHESNLVHPIFEPVRDIDAGTALLRNLGVLADRRVPCTVIVNPQVGEMQGTSKSGRILNQLEPLFRANDRMRIGIHLTSEIEVSDLIDLLSHAKMRYAADIFYGTSAISAGTMLRLAALCDVKVHFAEDKNSVRRYRQAFPNPQTGLLRDYFSRQERNQDYFELEESIFTEDNIFFKEDNYIGFGDYQTIGKGFREGGSLPRVVAIHLTYQRPYDEAILIRHFCSTPNGSSADTAGKYLEALSKLVSFANEEDLDNPAIRTFRSHLEAQRYPGLGVIKKISIQNHIFVAIEALNRG